MKKGLFRSFYVGLLLLTGLLAGRGASAAPKVVLPEDKCIEHLESLSKSISGQLDSFIFYGKSPTTKSPTKKDPQSALSETSESKVKVTVGQDVFDFTVKDLYECRVEKLTVTKGE